MCAVFSMCCYVAAAAATARWRLWQEAWWMGKVCLPLKFIHIWQSLS